MLVWVEKKELKKEKGQKVKYKMITEFLIEKDLVWKYKAGDLVDINYLEDIGEVSVIGDAKWKGFQWVMKRFHTKWWPETHGSKFHRQVWSLGNRKPRRVQMWHPHAWRMWGQQVTLSKISIIDKIKGDEQLLILKWSLPWAYNGMLKLVV